MTLIITELDDLRIRVTNQVIMVFSISLYHQSLACFLHGRHDMGMPAAQFTVCFCTLRDRAI